MDRNTEGMRTINCEQRNLNGKNYLVVDKDNWNGLREGVTGDQPIRFTGGGLDYVITDRSHFDDLSKAR